MITAFNFLNQPENQSLKEKIDFCLISVVSMLNKYKKHTTETTKTERENASDFLRNNDSFLNMMLEEQNCRSEVVDAMEKYATTSS